MRRTPRRRAEDEIDARLLRRWRAGEREAGHQLIDRHLGWVAAFYLREAPEDAEDLIQQVVELCLRHEQRVRSCREFRPYLNAVVRHLLQAHRRRGDGHGTFTVEDLELCDPDPLPDEAVDRDRRRERVGLALRGISPPVRAALELKYDLGLTGPEVAARLRVPEGTVRSRVRLGITRLRSAFAEAS